MTNKPTERGLMFQATSTYGHGVLIVFGYADDEVDDIASAIVNIGILDLMDWELVGECIFPAILLPEQTLGDTEQVWEYSNIKRQMPHLRIWENGNCC